MKIILASFFEEEYHGMGRKIGVCPSKPKDLPYECSTVITFLAPDSESFFRYHKEKKTNPDAGRIFVEEYKAKLEQVFTEAKQQADEEGKTIQEILPLQSADVLLSWERKGNISFRNILAEYLRNAGYEVEEN